MRSPLKAAANNQPKINVPTIGQHHASVWL
jgi:hypothetical protein